MGSFYVNEFQTKWSNNVFRENCVNEIQLIALKVKMLQQCCQIQFNTFDAIRKIKLGEAFLVNNFTCPETWFWIKV